MGYFLLCGSVTDGSLQCGGNIADFWFAADNETAFRLHLMRALG
jgi:hypothetical protein